MSHPAIPVPAKLLVGAFTADPGLFPAVAERLVAALGPADTASPWFSFHHTDYYRAEFGGPLSRRFLGFADLVGQDSLPRVKLLANRLEEEFSENGKRRVNLDPGLLTAERFVLATGKNFAHRIYLSDGIFADLTLVYARGAYRPLAWTFPDYREGELIAFLAQVRVKYLADLARLRKGEPDPDKPMGGQEP